MFPVLFSLGPITIYTFGVFALLAFFFGTFIIWKRGREANFAEGEIFDSVVLVTLSGLVGARITYIVLNFERFGFSPLLWISFLRVPGLMFYGGLVGGVVVGWIICRRKRLEFFTASDIAVTGLSLSQAIGWLGAFFSGFGIGKAVDRFGLVFPGFTEPRFPAQFVWVFGFALIFLFLWKVEERYRMFDWYRGKRVTAETGFLFFSYLALLGILQLLVALFVAPSVYLFRVPVEVVVALFLFGLGMGGLYVRSGRELSQDGAVLAAFLGGRGRSGMVWLKQGSRRLRRLLGKKGKVESDKRKL